MKTWLIDAGVTAVLTAMALAAGGAALIVAEFGGPLWMLLALLVPLVTVGAPSLAAVLLLAAVWPGPSLRAFVIAAAVLAFCSQFAAVAAVRRWRRRARASW
jgi:hypothetical protein